MNNLLYIGLNCYASAGKDTVAKMLKIILSNKWQSYDECKKFYFDNYINPLQPATFNFNNEDTTVKCIAYADQLKVICSKIFGIPLNRFYMNKSNLWVCINDKFQYTEIQPELNYIITADEYYYNGSSNYDINKVNSKYWMSLREILVYDGTYVLQKNINNNIFVNIIHNIIKEDLHNNNQLKYVIVTDNRFFHELNYIHEQNGITLSIIRNSISQLNNIAEHELDNFDDYDYVSNNSGSYDELFAQIWELIHNNLEFANITYNLSTYENINNYIRLIGSDDEYNIYKLCGEYPINEVYKSNGEIIEINPIGGPQIKIGTPLDIIGTNDNLIPEKIIMNEDFNKYLLYIRK